VHLTLVKSFAQKTIFQDLGKFSIGNIVLWLKLFSKHLLLRKYTFEISMKRQMFYAPFDLFKEKKFSIKGAYPETVNNPSMSLIEGCTNMFKALISLKLYKCLNTKIFLDKAAIPVPNNYSII
jgi:hypothetical protein